MKRNFIILYTSSLTKYLLNHRKQVHYTDFCFLSFSKNKKEQKRERESQRTTLSLSLSVRFYSIKRNIA